MRNAFPFLMLILFSNTYAQLNKPADETLARNAEEQYVFLSDNVKFERFVQARKPLWWIIKNTPDLHESVYVNGIKLYQTFLDNAKEPTIARAYQDTILILYDLRIKYFNAEKSIIDRKTSTTYNFYRDRPEKYTELLTQFDRAYELLGSDVGINNLAAYMDVVKKYHQKVKVLTRDEILSRYYRIMDAIDAKMKPDEENENLEKIRAVANKILLDIIKVDCEFIKKELVPQMDKDFNAVKRVVSLSLSQGCTDQPFFIEGAKKLVVEKPDYTLLRLIAFKEIEKGKTDEAMKYFNMALNNAKDSKKKATIYYDIALQMRLKDKKSEARNYAEKALEQDASLKKAYKLIGDLYYNSFEDCKKGISKVDDRAVFWLAYEMYEKADDREMMNNASQQFPLIEDIFNEVREEGQLLMVNCWINKSTTIKRRPK